MTINVTQLPSTQQYLPCVFLLTQPWGAAQRIATLRSQMHRECSCLPLVQLFGNAKVDQLQIAFAMGVIPRVTMLHGYAEFQNSTAGWWYTYPSGKYGSVGTMTHGTMKKHVPNRQLDSVHMTPLIFFSGLCIGLHHVVANADSKNTRHSYSDKGFNPKLTVMAIQGDSMVIC